MDMKTRLVLSLLLSFLMAIGVRAEEKSSLFVFLKDGSKVQFFLPSQEPTVKYQKGVMTVSYRGLDASEQTLDFERDQVDYLKVDKSDLTVIDEVKGDESRIRFDLTRKGVVGISGLQQADRIMVCCLDGKSVDAAISRHEGEATIDLSRQPRGVYLISVNQRFTFKLMKP